MRMNSELIVDTKEKLKDWLTSERKYYNNPGILQLIFPVTENDILYKHQVLLRKTEFYFNTHNRFCTLFYKTLLYRVQNKYSLHIPINTCGKGLHIMHVGPVLINGNSKVGENCAFHINTALVADGLNSFAPVLENDVVIGIGAVVVGAIHIAKGVAIGANAVVTKNVNEPDIAVAGNPAMKVSNNGRKKWNKQK